MQKPFRYADGVIVSFEIDLGENVGQMHVIHRLVDDQPHGAILAMRYEINHRLGKPLVANIGRCDEELSFERVHANSLSVRRPVINVKTSGQVSNAQRSRSDDQASLSHAPLLH